MTIIVIAVGPDGGHVVLAGGQKRGWHHCAACAWLQGTADRCPRLPGQSGQEVPHPPAQTPTPVTFFLGLFFS